MDFECRISGMTRQEMQLYMFEELKKVNYFKRKLKRAKRRKDKISTVICNILIDRYGNIAHKLSMQIDLFDYTLKQEVLS